MVELSELLLQRRCDQRRGRESLSPVDHTVAHQGDGVASAVEGRSKLLVKDGIEGFTVTATVVGLPDPCPGRVHQGGLETGAAEVDDEGKPRHQRTSQLISTLRGSTFQMLLQYSAIERSEEKKPVRAVLRTDMRFQCMRSVQARLTVSWALT